MNGDKLYITIQGKEKTKWIDHESHGHGENRRTRRVKRKAKDIFLDQKQMVFDFAGGVPVGQWSFPFSVHVPEWCPSSFFFAGGQESKLQICYKVHAEVLGPSNEVVEAKKRLIMRKAPQIQTG